MDSSQLFSSPANTTTTTTTATSSTNPISNELSRDIPGDSMRRFPEIESLAFDVRKYPRNPFHSFLSTDPSPDHLRRHNNNITTNNHHHGFISSAREDQEEVDEQDLELNLGLSLGGRFGIDKSRKRLTRSSSIAGTIPLAREQETMAPPPGAVSALVRTSSLPTETEEEWRRRKELQSLKRMEAKRRRSEKQRNSKDCLNIAAGEERDKGGLAGDTGISMNFRGRLERERQHLGFPQKFNSTSSVAGLGLAGQGVAGADRRDTDMAGVKGKRNFFSSLHGLIQHQQQQQQQGSQGSVESHGGGSSTGASDPDSVTHQGSSRSPATISLLQERSRQDTTAGSSSGPKPVEGPSGPRPTPEQEEKHHKRRESGGMEDMPCVFTIGDGPNGRKVEGILYKYGKGEEVRIMCVCHGSFFSPAEFVKHAGGRDVEHPLRHIVVNPCAAPFQ